MVSPLTLERLAVLTPIRNGGAFADRYAKMILNLSAAPREIVLVDDHSTDGSPDLIEALLRSGGYRTVSIHRANGSGLANARNEGLACLTADYVALLDVDDCWPRERLSYLAPYLNTTSRRLLHGGYETWCEGVRLQDNACRLASGPKAYLHLLNGSRCIGGSASGAILHRESALKIGGFDESFAYGEDYEFWLRYVRSFGALAIPAANVMIERSGGMQPADPAERLFLDFTWRARTLEEHLSKTYGGTVPGPILRAAWTHYSLLLLTWCSAQARTRNTRRPMTERRPLIPVRWNVSPKASMALVFGFFNAIVILVTAKFRKWYEALQK